MPKSTDFPRRVTSADHIAFIRRAQSVDTEDCVIWPFGRGSHGYGAACHGGQAFGAHVLSCEMAHGPRPAGKWVAHSCNVRLCINPRHLRWATPKENQADRLAHGTDHRGEKHKLAKLTNDAVRVIKVRLASGERRSRLAAQYGVSVGHYW